MFLSAIPDCVFVASSELLSEPSQEKHNYACRVSRNFEEHPLPDVDVVLALLSALAVPPGWLAR